MRLGKGDMKPRRWQHIKSTVHGFATECQTVICAVDSRAEDNEYHLVVDYYLTAYRVLPSFDEESNRRFSINQSYEVINA